MNRTFIIILSMLSVSIGLELEAQPLPFVLEDGDRVVFLGNSFFERALDYGHIETSIALRWPERQIAFRNLGWDGDTVFGHSRAGGRRRAVFGDTEEGFQRMVAHVQSWHPTAIFLAYGFNESFEGPEGIDKFRTGLKRLITELDSGTTRFVLISPTPLEAGFGTELEAPPDLGRSYVDSRNAILEGYCGVMSEMASSDRHHFIDLFHAVQQANTAITDNGIHLTKEGYELVARMIGDQLSLGSPKIDLRSQQVASIREAIVRKNTLYFHRWRPRNDAFVYGERKSEQQIAQAEPKEFEPFIARQEQVIWNLLAEIGGKK